MRRISRLVLYVAGGVVIVIVLAMVAVPLLLNTDAWRERLQARASEVAEMDVGIDGDLRIRLFPRLQFVVEEVHAGRDGAEIASAASVAVGVDLRPLLRGEVNVRRIAIQDPVLALERYPDGRFNFESEQDDTGPLPAFDLERITVTNATVHYLEGQSGSMYAGNVCDGEVSELMLTEGPREALFRNLALRGDLACDEVTRNDFAVRDASIAIAGNGGVFTIEPIALAVFGATGAGILTVDANGEVPRYELEFTLPKFRSEAVFETMTPEQMVSGNLDFSAQLAMQGTTVNAITQSMTGQLSLRGEQLVLQGIALDEELERFESTQNFNIVDMGALFFAGPLGLVVTKGYDYASLFQNSGSRSEIQELVSEWTVTNGVAHAEDVAMATMANRIAVRGSLDFNTGEFIDLKMAVLDTAGCARIEQAVHGSFREPEIEKPGILQSLAAPAVSLVQQGLELLPGEEESCDVFYSGSLPHPE